MGATYAGILGPLAFVLALTRGLIDGSSADSVLQMALASLLVFATLGYVSGRVAEQVLWDALKSQFEDQMHARAARPAAPAKHRQ